MKTAQWLKRRVNIGLICVMISLCSGFFADCAAADHPILYLFWGKGCPHCEDEKDFLTMLRKDYPQLEMRWFEVWDHPEFAKLADALRQAYHLKITSVPLTIIGTWAHIGFQDYATTGIEIAEQVEICLKEECHDPLEKLGEQEVVMRINAEVASNEPNGWEYYPAATDPQTAARTNPQPSEKIVVYYFHGTYRCPSCTTIEELTEFAVTEGFQDALQDGRLEFKAINVETPETRHFIKDYQLYTKSVIVSEMVDGKEQRWKNLGKIWQLFMKEKAFTEYIQQEVAAYLTGKE